MKKIKIHKFDNSCTLISTIITFKFLKDNNNKHIYFNELLILSR